MAVAASKSTLLGRPVWYELMTTDMQAAEAFYTAVVGWTTEPFAGAASPTRRSIAAVTWASAASWPGPPT